MLANKKIGKIIKLLRLEHDMTQDELANILGVQGRAVCQIEKGNVAISIKNLEVIAKHFGIPLKYLVDFNFVRRRQTDDERLESIKEDLLTASSDELKLIQKLVKSVIYK